MQHNRSLCSHELFAVRVQFWANKLPAERGAHQQPGLSWLSQKCCSCCHFFRWSAEGSERFLGVSGAGTIMHLLVCSLLLAAAARSGKWGFGKKAPFFFAVSPDSSVACSRFPEPTRAVAHTWRRGLGGIFWWSTRGSSLARRPGGVRRAGGGGPEHADHSTESKRSGRRWGGALVAFQHSRSYSRLFCSLLDPEPKESSAWKIALLGAIMFVSLLGSLSLAYYMCVWRGGRIHYSLQKDAAV